MTAPIVIIGAGAAGLATARELARRRIPFRLLERGATPGQTWHDLYDSLVLHTGRHLSGLPGMRMPRGTPLFPRRLDYHGYLCAYAERHGLHVETNTAVCDVARADGVWRVRTERDEIDASAVVVATGIVANPYVPELEGGADFEAAGGTVFHSVEYRRPDAFIGRRVLVVGVGNSGGEIGSELSRAGAHVDVVVRSGAHVVPLTIAGVPIQYLSTFVRKLPRGAQERVADAVRILGEKRRGPPVLPRPAQSVLDAIPLIGFHLVDEIRAGRIRVRPAIHRLRAGGARFSDGTEADYDVVILATGFRPALGILADRVRTDARGFALRSDRVSSAEHRGLYFVGHNYDARGGLLNIATDSVVVAEVLARRS
jgi:indole-3-pyruvate monooxygenase